MIKKAATAVSFTSVGSDIVPRTSNVYKLGGGSFKWVEAHITNFYLYGTIISGGNGAILTKSQVSDGASANAFEADTYNALSNAAATLAKFKNAGVLKFSVHYSGKSIYDATDSSGTPGAATIDKPSGQVSVASGVSSVVVTNAVVSATSVVTAVLQDNTDAIQIRSVVPTAGSFTINLTGNTTAARKVGFVVFN